MSEAMRKRGDETVTKFCLLSGFDCDESEGGDVSTLIGKDKVTAEVKQSTDDGQVHQVRAVRYLPLVVLRRDDWFVVPAHVIVIWAACKQGGQHVALALECASLSHSEWGTLAYSAQVEGLRDHVIDAYNQSQSYPKLREVMHNLTDELKTLRERYLASVRNVCAGDEKLNVLFGRAYVRCFC